MFFKIKKIIRSLLKAHIKIHNRNTHIKQNYESLNSINLKYANANKETNSNKYNNDVKITMMKVKKKKKEHLISENET